MPQLVKKRRSGWAVLAAGALVASLLAVGTGPAGAAVDSADHATKLSACVGAALNDHMFTDVSDGHAFKDAINCIAYYGITNGTGDGSTFSPNDDVTRAQMAVFIARAAAAAGADLGDAMDVGFTDIGDTWAGARDAINKLGAKGVIPKGGAFRPDDAITRAEMATFLVGLLVKTSSIVSRGSDGIVRLGSGSGSAFSSAADTDAAPNKFDDYFGDSRSSLPVATDRDISALWELGVTKGASPAAGAVDGKAPLDFNYNPSGTVNRGAMAAFITRALAHTSARPEGVTAQYDGPNVVVSVRDADFMPRSNVVVDVFTIDTAGVDLAFNSNGTCNEADKLSNQGTTACTIDGTDPITGASGDVSVPAGTIADGGTTVWAWTGADKATVKSGTKLFRLDISKSAAVSIAARVRITTGHTGAKAKLGTSVMFKVQLQDANGNNVNYGVDGKKPAKFFVTLTTTAIVANQQQAGSLIYNPQGSSSVVTLPVVTGADGSATFSASGLPDPAPAVKADKYKVDVAIQPQPNGNAPEVTAGQATMYYVDAKTAAETATSTGLVNVRVGTGTYATDIGDDSGDAVPELFFSTAAPNNANAKVTVKPAAKYVAAGSPGSNRATVTVTDEYGDPVTGAQVFLTSSIGAADSAPSSTLPANSAYGEANTVPLQLFTVGSDGYTFGWTRTGAAAGTETLTAYWRWRAATTGDNAVAAARVMGTATVEWATVAKPGDGNNPTGTNVNILHVDKENNRIFVGSAGSVIMVSYDSNDRYNIDPPGDTTPVAASTYAAFEKSITASETEDVSDNLTWNIAGSGSRAVNTWTLLKAGSG